MTQPQIIDIVEVTKPISSPIRNAYIDFTKMTASLVAVVTNVVRDGRRVVRLKSGDPLVFGRAGEEMAALRAAGGADPRWFRGSTARYSRSAIAEIRKMGLRVAGYSVNGDGGSLPGAAASQRRIAAAMDGDVVIAHINQPSHAAGEGVVKGILDLKAKGFAFVRLSDVETIGSDGTAADSPKSF